MTHISPISRPFTHRLVRLREFPGLTYSQMATTSGVRSLTWFQQLCTSDRPWGSKHEGRRNPPGPETWPGLATLLRVDEETVRVWIAKEWLGVDQKERVTARVRGKAGSLNALSESDAALINTMLARLGEQAAVSGAA